MDALIIIEAPGKLAALSRVVAQVGEQFAIYAPQILATKGHIAGYAAGLGTLGVDAGWTETGYGLLANRRTETAAIRRAAEQASVVIIATDDDDDGDVIARDVHRLVLDSRPALRCRLRSIDPKGVRQALQAARQISSSIAVRGDARRIADRVIGACLSDISNATHKLPVGRVFTCTLANLAQHDAELGFVRASARAADGGAPFLAIIPIHRRTDVEALMVPPACALAVLQQQVRQHGQPWHFADAVTSISLSARCTVSDAASRLQAAYESGYISYPRTTSRGLSAGGCRTAEIYASSLGCDVSLARFQTPGPQLSGPHEALRPSDGLFTFEREDDARNAAIAVARNLVEAGQECLIELPDTAPLIGTVWERYAALFMRVKRQGYQPWRPASDEHAVELYPTDVALFKFMADHGLGRPGTWVRHVAGLVQRGVLGKKLSLTPHGHALRELGASKGIDSSFVQRMNAALDASNASTGAMVARDALLSHLSAGAFETIDSALRTPASSRNIGDTPSFG